MEFTEPLDADVVAVAQIAEFTIPNLTSLPSMFPPDDETGGIPSGPVILASAGLLECSLHKVTPRRTQKIRVMAASTAHPCRVSPTIFPKV